MRLILDIALTHIAGRGRQTVVAVIGVAVGVGFSIAMAALMQGGQDDFVAQLVDTMPHVADHRRAAHPAPPAGGGGLRRGSDRRAASAEDPRGILNPTAALAWLEAWVPGGWRSA